VSPPEEDESAEMSSVAVASSAIAVLTLVSRITGFMRGLVIAAVLGPTFFGNLFLVTNSLPNLLYEFAIGSLLVSVLVPPLVRHLDMGEPERAQRIANGMLGFLCVIFLGITVLLVAAGPVVLRLLGAGIHDPAVLADQRRVGWPLMALVIPQAILYAFVGTSAAVQNARDRFFLTAAAPIAENVGTMTVFIAFAIRWGTGVDLHDVTTGQMLFLGLGATAAVAAHAAVQWWGAWKVGHVLLPSAGWRDPDVRNLMRLGLRSLGYAAFNSGRYLVALIAAGSVRGGVVAYQLALNFRDLPNALVTRPLSVTSLPALSRQAHQGRWRDFGNFYRSTVRLSGFLQGLATVILVVLVTPIVRTITFGGMGSGSGRSLLVAALATMSLGIVGDGTFVLATNASYARRDAKGPLRIMLFRTVVTTAGALIALSLDGRATLIALGLSIAGADLAAGQLLHRHLESRLETAGRGEMLRPALNMLIVGLVAGASGAATLALVAPGADAPRVAQLACTLVGVAVVVAVYLGAARLRRLPELGALGQFVPADLRRRFHRLPRQPEVASTSTVTDRESGRGVPPIFVPYLLVGGAAVVLGLASTTLDVLLPAALVGVAVIVAVFARPPVLAYVWLGASPLIAGIDRGAVVPLLRLNEALLAVVSVGVLLRALVWPRARCRLTAADASVVAVGLAGSVVPLIVLYSRKGAVTVDELLYAAPIVKLVLVYVLFRVVLRKPREVRTALVVGLTSASIAAVIGFFQSLGLFGVRGFLTSGLYATGRDAIPFISSGRGSSTLGSAIGASGLYIGYLLIALAWIRRPGSPRRFLEVVIVALIVGLAGTAQFTALVGLVVGLAASAHSRSPLRFGRAHRRPRRSGSVRLTIGGAAVAFGCGLLALGPRVVGLLQGQLPQSWTERWYNLSTHFLSELGLNTNLLVGVSPVTQVRDPRGFVEWIWIESGYVQLLYTGGLVMLGAFLWMIYVHLRDAWDGRHRVDEFGVCAAAAWTMGVTVCVLMLLDPHLTIRGTSDLLFPLLAMSATGVSLTGPHGVRPRRVAQPVELRTVG